MIGRASIGGRVLRRTAMSGLCFDAPGARTTGEIGTGLRSAVAFCDGLQ